MCSLLGVRSVISPQDFGEKSVFCLEEVHFQSALREIVFEKNLNFLISFWREV